MCRCEIITSTFDPPLAKNGVVQATHIRTKFVAETRTIGRPISQQPFPDSVEYPEHCRGMCKTSTSDSVFERYMVMLKMLSKTASWCRGPNKVPGLTMVLVVDLVGGSRDAMWFWWMLTASYQHAQHPATETFWKLDLDLASGPAQPDLDRSILRL